MNYSPIALFVYNRPHHTRQTIEALQRNETSKDSDLFIFSDAARSDHVIAQVSAVREYIATVTGFKTVRIIEREKNLGLANSVINGVTQLCRDYGKVIVLEDDLVVAPRFLEYMNLALEKYKDERKVMQISGYMFPVNIEPNTEAIFLPFTTSWGWATWLRAWNQFDPEAKAFALLESDRRLRKSFDLDGAYPYFKMLKSQLKGYVDSWAIRWYLNVFELKGLVLYPPRSLVLNKGMDGSGTHGANSESIIESNFNNSVDLNFPMTFSVSFKNLELIRKLHIESAPTLLNRIKGFFR